MKSRRGIHELGYQLQEEPESHRIFRELGLIAAFAAAGIALYAYGVGFIARLCGIPTGW
jgi:hypothetical protein